MSQRTWGGRRIQRIRQAIYTRDHGICQICGQPAPFDRGHVDHILPQLYGGTDRSTNLRWTHARCNLSKGHKLQGGGTLRTTPHTEGANHPSPPHVEKATRGWC